MESRIMQVFYDNYCYPFKDSARSVRYPVVGNTFAGTNKTTEIHFYVDRIGGTSNISWVLVSKLPNGKLGYELLSTIGNDVELGEQYVSFNVSSYYTQYQGVVKLALRGYQGEINFVEDTSNPGVYVIVGEPLIEVTGTIDLAINYSPFVNTGTQVLPTDLDQIFAWLSSYLPIANGIVVINNISLFDFSSYELGQVFYDKTNKQFLVKQLVSGTPTLVEINLKNYAKLDLYNVFANENEFTNFTHFYKDIYLNSSYLTLNDKTKFLVVDIQGNRKTYYQLPYDYSDLGSTKTYTLETKEDAQSTYSKLAFVELDGSSGFVTSKELEKLEEPNALIERGGDYYQKIAESLNTITFEIIPQFPDDYGNKVILRKDVIIITKTNLSWARTLTSKTVYKASQVDTLLNAKQDKLTAGPGIYISSGNVISSTAGSVSWVVVNTYEDLPSEGEEGVFYLIPNGELGSNTYDEYIWVDDKNDYEFIGSTSIDLSNYAQKGLIASSYNNTSTYSVGDLVIYNNVLYRCTTAITTAEDFDNTHWVATNIASELANMVTLDTAQIISGVKTFNATINTNTIIPSSNNSYDLGTSSYKWKDGYFKGQVYAQNTFNVINASDIVPSAITSSQKAILTNGKPTRIIGSLRGLDNPIIYNMYVSGTTYFGRIIGITSTGTMVDSICYIYNDAFFLDSVRIEYVLSSNYINIARLNNVNGKQLPVFPTLSTGDIYRQLVYKDDNTLAWDNVSGFKIFNAPTDSSSTLTQEQQDEIVSKGAIFNGRMGTSNYYNVVCFKGTSSSSGIWGVCVYSSSSGENSYFAQYRIESNHFILSSYNWIELKNSNLTGAVQGKTLPANPSNTGTFNYQMVGGTLTWKALGSTISDNTLTQLGYDDISIISISSDTTFTLKTPASGALPEYKAKITNSDTSNAIDITLPSGTIIKTNDSNIAIASNVFTLPASTTVELNIQDGHCIVFNWDI